MNEHNRPRRRHPSTPLQISMRQVHQALTQAERDLTPRESDVLMDFASILLVRLHADKLAEWGRRAA